MRIMFRIHIPLLLDIKEPGADFGVSPEDVSEFLRGKDVECAFALFFVALLVVTVCVFGGEEAAKRCGQGSGGEICDDVVDCTEDFCVAGQEEGVEVDREELPLVV